MKDLLIKFRDLLPEHFRNGMCATIIDLHYLGLLSGMEVDSIGKYIKDREPSYQERCANNKFVEGIHEPNVAYWWEKDVLQPRLSWLVDEIDNYNKPPSINDTKNYLQ